MRFTTLTDEVSETYGNDISWWVSELACRNSLTNEFFLEYCRIHFIRELMSNGVEIAEIRTDSPEVASILTGFLEGHRTNVTIIRKTWWQRLYACLPRVKDFFLLFIRELLYAALAKWFYPMQKGGFSAKTVLIDTFVFAESFSDNTFIDRYYGRLDAFFRPEEREKIVYAPMIMGGIKDLIPMFQKLRHVQNQFLLKEDLLTWRDIFWAFGFPFRIFRRKPRRWVENGIDFTSLARKIWIEHLFSANSVLGLMNYRFAQRVREEKIPLCLVIDWFENQIIDKGFNAGFRKYFPDIAHIGYEGFIAPPTYLCVVPSKKEYEYKVVPKTIAVTGPGLIGKMKEFCSDLDVIAAPGFRFSWLWKDFLPEPDSSYHTILIALDSTIEASRDILHCAITALEHDLPPNVRFWVKPHPASMPIENLLATLDMKLPRNFTVMKGDFSSILRKCDMILTNTSSTCMEAIVLGIPALIAVSQASFSRNPIPSEIPGELWRMCFTSEDTARAIGYFSTHPLDCRTRKALGQKIRSDYFTEVTFRTVRDFLRITTT